MPLRWVFAPRSARIVPPIFHGQIITIAHETSGQIILLGVVICVIGVSKDREVTFEEKAEAGETDYNFGKGIAVAVFAGIMSSFFAFALMPGRRSPRSPRANCWRMGGSISGPICRC